MKSFRVAANGRGPIDFDSESDTEQAAHINSKQKRQNNSLLH